MSNPTRIVDGKGNTLADMDFVPQSGETIHTSAGEFKVTGRSRIEEITPGNSMKKQFVRIVTAEPVNNTVTGGGRRGLPVEG